LDVNRKKQQAEQNYVMRTILICSLTLILMGSSDQGGWVWWSMYATLLVEMGNKQNFSSKFHVEDLGTDGMIIVKLIFEK